MTWPVNDTRISSLEYRLELTYEEVEALLKECLHSYISYENPIAREVISKMYRFIGEPLKRDEQL